MILIVRLLGSLVRPEIDRSACALHDNIGAETAENPRFVSLGRVQGGHGDIF